VGASRGECLRVCVCTRVHGNGGTQVG